MLDLALRAEIPLIAVRTTDTVNVAETLAYLAQIPEFVLADPSHIAKIGQKSYMPGYKYFYCIDTDANWTSVYEQLQESERVLVVVNPEEVDHAMYDAGTITLPKEVLLTNLSTFIEENLEEIANTLTGLTLKEVYEICRMCQIFDACVTPEGIIKIRKKYMANRFKGLIPVDTTFTYYMPQEEITKWLSVDGKLFHSTIPNVLLPRGILFTGYPGTGKTLGAKFIASELRIPLYRLDLAGMLDKYQGVPESRLEAVLGALDNMEPCVCLIDEVEKLFTGHDNTGTTQKLLSMLLWWMQEKTSRVLVIMTTNNHNILPKELYRPGRINSTIEFKKMYGESQIRQFISGIMTSLTDQMEVPSIELDINFDSEYSQAELTEMVYSEIKKTLI